MVTHEESSESETEEARRELDGARKSVVLSETVTGRRRGSRGWGLGGSEVAGFGGFASATSRCVSPQPHVPRPTETRNWVEGPLGVISSAS
jgi:hypothetical protein